MAKLFYLRIKKAVVYSVINDPYVGVVNAQVLPDVSLDEFGVGDYEAVISGLCYVSFNPYHCQMHERCNVLERPDERFWIFKPHPMLVHPAARAVHVKGKNLRKP